MQLPRRFKKLFYACSQEQDFQVGLSELKILNELQKIGPCKMSELADALVVTMGGLTPHMDKLVEKGFVRRFRDEDRDRRLVLVEITESGKKALKDVKEHFLATLEDYLSKFNERQKKDIASAVKTLRETIDF
jgi:DNA-binding MarR family transcriptional regulator